jgi:hypothetical protein
MGDLNTVVYKKKVNRLQCNPDYDYRHISFMYDETLILYNDMTLRKITSPRWWRQYVPLKRRYTSTKLNGAMSQKAVIIKSF